MKWVLLIFSVATLAFADGDESDALLQVNRADVGAEKWKRPDWLCKRFPNFHGCPKPNAPVCCQAMIPSCQACKAGQTEEEFCLKNSGKFGCDVVICCQADTAACWACKKQQTIEEYCNDWRNRGKT